jgi:GR25 family glycosyltransferase involved in LPS biosynthesis
MTAIDHIYVVHYTPLIERKAYLLQKFKEAGIPQFTFCEKYDRNTVTKETVSHYTTNAQLRLPGVCITITHIEIYREILEKGYARCLILEDDAILCDDFFTLLNAYNKMLPNDFDMGSINNGCNMHAKTIDPSTIWYPATTTRTCCAYIISGRCCAKLLSSIVPFQAVIDHELNRQIAKLGLRMFWAEPTLVVDGSEFKHYPRSHDY